MSPDDFDDRIARAKAAGERHHSPASGGEDPGIESAMSFGMRAGAQFVSAVVLGGGLGWLIDHWLKTKPFGMLILMVLMFIAAMANVWRSMNTAVETATIAAQAAEKSAVTEGTEEVDGKSA